MRDWNCWKCGDKEASAETVRLAICYNTKLCVPCRNAWDEHCKALPEWREIQDLEARLHAHQGGKDEARCVELLAVRDALLVKVRAAAAEWAPAPVRTPVKRDQNSSTAL